MPWSDMSTVQRERVRRQNGALGFWPRAVANINKLGRRVLPWMAMAAEFQLPARIKLPTLAQEELRRPDPAAPTKGQPWTEKEHMAFLQGLKVFGKGKWRQISRLYLGRKKTPTQVASHAQKYFARLQGTTKRKSRFTVLEESALKHAAEGAIHCQTTAGAFCDDTSTPAGPATSEDVSASSEGCSQSSSAAAVKPCRPLATRPTPPQQDNFGSWQALLSITQKHVTPDVVLPSAQSAFISARPAALMV